MNNKFFKKISLVILFVLVFALILSGCSSSPRATYPGSDNNSEGSIDTDIILNQTNRKILYSVDVNLVTKDFQKTINDLYTAVAKDESNWIKQSDITSEGEYRSALIIVKVKTASLNAFLDELSSLGTVTSQKLNSEDITYNYATKEAELAALNEEKAYYLELLEKPEVIENVILMSEYVKELSNINKRIAMIKDVLTKYDNDLEYSTITIHISYNKVTVEEKESFGTQLKKVFTGSLRYLVGFFKGTVMVVLAILPFAATAGVILLIIFFANKQYKAYKLKKKPSETSNNNEKIE